MSCRDKGNWSAERHGNPTHKVDFLIWSDTRARAIACVDGFDNAPDVEGNAKLLAAAPEMLEILRAVKAAGDRYYDEDFLAAHARVDTLLAKFEGA